MLHIHGNVKDSEEGSWKNHVLQSITDIARSEGTTSLPIYLNSLVLLTSMQNNLEKWNRVEYMVTCCRLSLGGLNRTRWKSEMVCSPHTPSCCRCEMPTNSGLRFGMERVRYALQGNSGVESTCMKIFTFFFFDIVLPHGCHAGLNYMRKAWFFPQTSLEIPIQHVKSCCHLHCYGKLVGLKQMAPLKTTRQYHKF